MSLITIWNELLTELTDRIDMPQIDQTDLPKAFSILSDADIGITMKSVFPSELKHSQTKVNKNKIASIIRDLQSGKKMPPIVVANDYSIVDGHHRQMAYNQLNPKQQIRVVMIDLPINEAITAYKKVENLV